MNSIIIIMQLYKKNLKEKEKKDQNIKVQKEEKVSKKEQNYNKKEKKEIKLNI